MKRVLFITHSATQRPSRFMKNLPANGWEPIALSVDEVRSRFDKWMTVRRAMRIFKDTGFDVVYAAGPARPLGGEIAKATARPLIADCDELQIEPDVVERAAAVICASDTVCRTIASAHPSVDSAKFLVLHHGFDAGDFATTVGARQREQFIIAYAGPWEDNDNPGALYNTIDWIRRSEPDALRNVEVIAAGFTPGEARRRGLARWIREAGVLPQQDATALMQSADLLYLPHADDERPWSLPERLFEYLASGSPTVAHTSSDGEIARIIQRVGGARVCPCDDPGHLYHTLLEACRWKTVRVPERDAEALGEFERRRLTARLAALFSSAASRVTIAAPQPRLAYAPLTTNT